MCSFGIFGLLELAVFLDLAHRFHQTFYRLLHGQQIVQPDPNLNLNGFFRAGIALDIGELLFAIVGVVFLIWQYNAAGVALGLGYPARTSPGFGVGSWFIPVVNLWIPYWALGDCLPPGHQLRSTALWAWLAYVFTGLFSGATCITAFFSEFGAIVPLVLAVACLAIAVTLGCRLISATNDAHREALGAGA